MDRNTPLMWDEEFNPGLWPRIRKWAKNTVIDQLNNMQGKPGKLIRLIEEGVIQPSKPIEHEKSIWFSSVARWELWNRDFEFQPLPIAYWKYSKEEHRHNKKSIHIEALDNLISCEVIENGSFDINEIQGISASKSDGHFFNSIEEFATTRCQEFIGSGHPEDFHKNMKWREIRLHSMTFRDISWSCQSPFWMNSGGSHHFAAAHYIASEKNINYELIGKIKKFSVNKYAAEKLVSDWDMFLIDSPSLYTGFIEALCSFKCDFCACDLPRELFKSELDGDNSQKITKIVFLKKGELKSESISQVLKNSGFTSFNTYIKKLH